MKKLSHQLNSDQLGSAVLEMDYASLKHHFTVRPRSAHKGDFGHVLVLGGDEGMAGACRMAAESCLRVGAGLVSIGTRQSHAAVICAQRPELMCRGVETSDALTSLLSHASVLVVGPGLGQGLWGEMILRLAFDAGKPMVLDADGLNLLAKHPEYRDHWVLTPHPGEAARLLDCSVADIQADRHNAVRRLQQRYGGVAVLKGAGTLVCTKNGEIHLCREGNPGMASGGMGDVLSGIIGGMLAQGFDHALSARLGVVLHAAAGDLAAADGERGMLASDLMCYLRGMVNPA